MLIIYYYSQYKQLLIYYS